MEKSRRDPKAILCELRSRLRKALKHDSKKLAKQNRELEESQGHERYSQIADSLMAQPDSAPRGTRETAVKNSHTSSDELITLNPKLDALQNAQLLYKKARKGRRGYETALEKVRHTKNAIQQTAIILDKTEQLLQDDYLLSTMDENQLTEIESQAAAVVPELQKGTPKGGAPSKEKIPFRRFHTDGWEIFMGKNSEQNDELSTRFAKPADIWLHVVAHAGSHVIIRRPKNSPPPPREVILKAASLAVWSSKAKHTSFAEVHVTEARFVHKRRHSPPGEVIAERCKSVRVEPRDPHELFGSR